MYCTLIICTYRRAEPLLRLLLSIQEQTQYPDEILVVDGSPDQDTRLMIEKHNFIKLTYFSVPPESRGLTRQRNFGVEKLNPETEIVAFLDDDTELAPDYFEQLKHTFEQNTDITGVGGVAINENTWVMQQAGVTYDSKRSYCFDGYVYKEAQRNIVRNYFGLGSDSGPGKMPEFSHGRTCGFPLTGKIYDADLLIGMSFAFRRTVFENIRFSKYFEGYGLYEDADFSLRAQQFGRNVIDTKLQLKHFHHPSGRPDHYKYGKMVVRNGWYVWRIKNNNPSLKARIKWNLITVLLTVIRFSNTFTGGERKAALSESLGRTSGWFSLLYKKPK